MNATPGAKNEYSRGSGYSGGDLGGSAGGSEPPRRRLTDQADRGSGGLILAGTLLAALLLLVAEFTTLYQVHLAGDPSPIKSVTSGSNHSYAMLVIGLGAAALGALTWRSGSRPALLAVGVLGLVALLIAVLGDLPDAHATGLEVTRAHGYETASSTPSAGLYMETLGAILLIATCGLGFLTLGAPAPRRPPRGSRGPQPGRPRPEGGEGEGGAGRGEGSWSGGRRRRSAPDG